jgi:4-hydroxy-tetrahydrodipicolinate synthase
MTNFRGTFTALITPFKNEKIDVKSFEKLLRQQLDGGVEGFVINGTTAECPTLNDAEKIELFRMARAFCGQDVTLIMGTGSNSTKNTIAATRQAQEIGADAALVVVPYYNKPPQRGLFAHFQKTAAAVQIPIILYNVPGRTITALATETIHSLSEIKNIVGIKEASGKIDFAKDIITACGEKFTLLSGDDGTYVDFLAAGGHGVISVATHVIPQQMVQWKKWVLAGELEKAKADIKKYSRLIDLLFIEANPIPVKKALQFMGVIESSELRLPLSEMDVLLAQSLKQEMEKVGVLK